MTIKELFDSKEISHRAYKLCSENRLFDLESILIYYKRFKEFSNINKIGSKTNNELINICYKYSDSDSIKNELNQKLLENVDINKLNKYNKFRIIELIQINFNRLPKRCKNILLYHFSKELDNSNFRQIESNTKIQFFSITFLPEIKYRLSKSSKGLLCLPDILSFIEITRNQLYILLNQINDDNKDIRLKLNDLKSIKIELIDDFIINKFNYLSKRNQNALNAYLNNNLQFNNICSKILLNKGFKIDEIMNVGYKSKSELNKYFKIVLKFIKKVSSINNQSDLISIKNQSFIENKFTLVDLPIEIIKSNSVLKLTDFLIEKNVFFDEKRNLIFLNSFRIFNEQSHLTISDLSQKIKLSYERIRQLRKSCYYDLLDQLIVIKMIEDPIFIKFANDDFIFFDKEYLEQINIRFCTNFSSEFLSFLFYIYFSDKFECFGSLEDKLLNNNYQTNNCHKWNYLYLINKKLCEIFDFRNLIDDISIRLSQSIEETYYLSITDYFLKFYLIKVEDSLLESIISSNVIKILNQEFKELNIKENNLVFERNKYKQVYKYAIDALEKFGSPTKIEKIFNLINNDFPNITKNIDSLKVSMIKSEEIVYLTKSRLYSLKKWEN